MLSSHCHFWGFLEALLPTGFENVCYFLCLLSCSRYISVNEMIMTSLSLSKARHIHISRLLELTVHKIFFCAKSKAHFSEQNWAFWPRETRVHRTWKLLFLLFFSLLKSRKSKFLLIWNILSHFASILSHFASNLSHFVVILSQFAAIL